MVPAAAMQMVFDTHQAHKGADVGQEGFGCLPCSDGLRSVCLPGPDLRRSPQQRRQCLCPGKLCGEQPQHPAGFGYWHTLAMPAVEPCTAEAATGATGADSAAPALPLVDDKNAATKPRWQCAGARRPGCDFSTPANTSWPSSAGGGHRWALASGLAQATLQGAGLHPPTLPSTCPVGPHAPARQPARWPDFEPETLPDGKQGQR